MRILWLCNSAPGVVRAQITGQPAGAVNWVDHVLSGLRQQDVTLRILFRGPQASGTLDERCSYFGFGEAPAHQYPAALEAVFLQQIREFQPDVIHSWGVEYGHTLAMVRAAREAGVLCHMAASIQGLCHYISRHYTQGIPEKVQKRGTFRDVLRRDNIRQQQEKFARRGAMEVQAIQALPHILGRTHWDRICTELIHPQAQYHRCNETLREEFYTGQWDYAACQRHRIFAPGCDYPVKGFHLLLEAFSQVVQVCPDATLAVPGADFQAHGWKQRLHQGSYGAYLARLAEEHGVQGRIEFLGSLSAGQMKAAFLQANVFVLPSTVENSPNSLGEAMLLGLPCIASDVGGVSSLLENGRQGWLYPADAPYVLAGQILEVFALQDQAAAMGAQARARALETHDPQKNLQALLDIYREVS